MKNFVNLGDKFQLGEVRDIVWQKFWENRGK